MARKPRYYSDDDIETGITASELRRAGRLRQKEYMRHWFHRNFEDPAQETPYNSREGGYLYVWGGPYNAHEQLFDEFGTLVPEKYIEEIANEVEGEDGIYDWAPGPDHPDMKQREEEWQNEERNEPSPQQDTLDQITDRLKAGVRPRYGDGDELDQRRLVLENLDTLRAALAEIAPAHGGIGHNRPPPDDGSPQAVVIDQSRNAEETIRTELAKAEPDALKIADATSGLQAALGWFGKKFDAAADSFAKGFGKTLGVAAASAVVAGGALLVPPLLQVISDLIHKITQWLSYVTYPF